jgi:hypothetical protein
MPERTVARNVETDVEPDVIFEILADPKLIPQWAPAFAETVESDTQERWRVSKGGSTFSLQAATTRPSPRSLCCCAFLASDLLLAVGLRL